MNYSKIRQPLCRQIDRISVKSILMSSTISRASVDLDSSMLNNSIGAPTPKLIPSETTSKTPVPTSNLIVPEWVHCEICKRREVNGPNNTRLALAYSHPCGHMICRDCAMINPNGNCSICSKATHLYPINGNLPPQIKVLFISRYELVHATESQVREQVMKLYSNMYKQLFDVFDYQDAKWNQLMMHRTDYLRQMSKIKKGMMEVEEMKRINKELFKIFQEQEQILRQNNQHTIGPYPRPSSVASSVSLNFRPPTQQQQQQQQRQQQIVHKPTTIGTSPNLQHHVPPPEPDKLMTYEQAMVYAHPALKDALRLAHRRKMSSKNSGPITTK